MNAFLGLDIGTTTLSAVAWEAGSGAVLLTRTREHGATRHPAPGRAELDLPRVNVLAIECLAEAKTALSAQGIGVEAIGVTGQQHGVALLDAAGMPLAPAITWQDRRVEERVPGSDDTYLERFITAAGGDAAFAPMGCAPAAGYMGPTLYGLRERGQLPAEATACFIPDALVAHLTGGPPCTDPTDAGSSALYDVLAGRWAWEIIARLDLPASLFPAVRPTGSLATGLAPAQARQIGLAAGTPVAVALGDNQASFLGSVAEPARSVLVNIGTGGQLSAQIDAFVRVPGFDTRAYLPGPDGAPRYLLVGAGYPGGSAYAHLAGLFRRIGQEVFGLAAEEPLYETMNRLAAAAPPGCDGLRCEPTFTGTRDDPQRRASFTGLSPDNLTPGHLARALLEGLTRGYGDLYAAMQPISGPRQTLIGSGNGLRRNPLLAALLREALGLPLRMTAHEEEAALGAALVAALAVGALEDGDAVGALLRYRE